MRLRRWLTGPAWRVTKLVVGVGIVILIWRRISTQSGTVWPSLGELDWPLMAVCVALMPVNVGLELSLWRTLLSGVSIELPVRRALPAVLSGFAAGAVSPGGVGDFIGRVVRVEKDQRWITGIAMALGRVAETITLCTVGLLASIEMMDRATGPLLAWIRTVVIIAVPVLLLLVALYSGALKWRRLGAYLRRWPTLQRSVVVASQISAGIRLRALAIAALRVTVFIGQMVLIVYAASSTSYGLPLLFAAAVVVYMLRALAPPVTFMGLGVREAASVGVLGLVGVAAPTALIASLFVFVINLAVPAIVGIPFLLYPSWNPVADPNRVSALPQDGAK